MTDIQYPILTNKNKFLIPKFYWGVPSPIDNKEKHFQSYNQAVINNNNNNNENQYLLQLSQDSEDAFAQIYQLYSGRIYGKLLKILKSELQAKEILQEIFLKIWNNRKNINPDKSFRSYLFQIAINSAYDVLRKSARSKQLQSQLLKVSCPQYSHIEEELISKENHNILARGINLLPPKRRNIFKLCKIDGISYDEVSRQLGISPSTISDHIVKANQFLKDYLLRTNVGG